jgi:hypothetical protein
MTRNFPSLQHPDKYAYKYDSHPDGYQGTVHCNFRVYETFGDGQCQHSPDWPIARNLMADYLASLATVMLEDTQLIDNTHYLIDCGPNQNQIAFAASVVHKESDDGYQKRRYCSLSELKVSSSASKEHDRRYERIQPWCDGSPDSIYRILIPASPIDLQRYAYAESIRQWIHANAPKLYMPLTAEFLKWGDRDAAHQLRHAYAACLSIIRSYRLRGEAITHLANIRPPKPRTEQQDEPPIESAALVA